MGKKFSNYTIGIFVLFLIVIFALYSNGFLGTVTGIQFISVPQTAFTRCELSDDAYTSDFYKFSRVELDCKQLGDTLTEDCIITLKLPDTVKSDAFVKNAGITYKVCTIGESCNLDEGKVVYTKQFFNTIERNLDAEINIPLNENQYLVAEYKESPPIGSAKLVRDGRWSISVRQAYLYNYDVSSFTNGQKLVNSRDCVIDDFESKNTIIEGIRSSGTLKNTPVSDSLSIRSLGATYTYITNYQQVAVQYDFINSDKTQYCTNYKIYEVEELDTNRGTYYVADTSSNGVIDTVECCSDGEAIAREGAGHVCDNFKIVKIEDASCELPFNPCPFENTYQTLTGKNVLTQTCVEGTCVNDIIEVECVYNEDCPSGYCDYDGNNPENSKCVNPKPVKKCGNGICEISFNEDINSCPQDCDPDYTNYLGLIIIGTIFAIGLISLIVIIVKMRGKK